MTCVETSAGRITILALVMIIQVAALYFLTRGQAAMPSLVIGACSVVPVLIINARFGLVRFS